MSLARFAPIFAVLAAALSAPASGGDWGARWQKSFDSDGRRFIPVELWTGSQWDGIPSINLPRTDLTFGKNGRKRVVGPRSWTHERSGTIHQIYERHNGRKIQYFAINRKRDGMGRVYDNRYPRYCPDEVKFPLGWWKDGEKRVYDIVSDGRLRRIEVTITRLSFDFGGIPHSLQFHWKLDDGTKPGSNNYYTYSPGRGLVEVVSNQAERSRSGN